MKKQAIIALLLSLLFVSIFVFKTTNSVVDIQVSYIEEDFGSWTAEVPPEVLTYDEKNNELKVFAGLRTHSYEEITFKYLSSWIEVDMPEITDPTFLINGRNAVFNIVKEEVPDKFTIDDYMTTTKQVLEKEENTNIIYNEKVTQNGIDGFNLIYTIEEDGVLNFLNQFCTIKNDKVYVFSYYADEENYENYLKEYEDLLGTLVIN